MIFNRFTFLFALILAFIPTYSLSGDGEIAKPTLSLSAKATQATFKQGEEITLDLEVSTDGDEPYDFLLGAPPQVFGIYVLGPWGPIRPDPKKIRPEHWMDQGHFKAQKVVISKGRPLRVKVPLSDYFAVGDPKVFKLGLYQINVKFYEAGLKVDSPMDSGAIAFRLQAK